MLTWVRSWHFCPFTDWNLPRRIALDISKIVDGQNASELPVIINTFSETAMINMSTVRKVGTYPDWDMMTEAVLLNANTTETDRILSLQTVILEALDQNLSLKVAGINPILAGKETERGCGAEQHGCLVGWLCLEGWSHEQILARSYKCLRSEYYFALR